jgi:hypothetical protein
MLSWIIILCLCLAGCQSVQEKNLELIRQRADQLHALNNWAPTWCRVETHLTKPTVARYSELYPDEKTKLAEETWAYTWKARKNSCEVTTLEPSPMTKNHQVFLDTAFCTLLQTHWVNSPFAELHVDPKDIVTDHEKVHIRFAEDSPLGIYLDPKNFCLQTKTKGGRTLNVTYSQRGENWLPESLVQTTGKLVIRVDGLTFRDSRLNGRPELASFWISAGETTPLQHTQVELSNCANY